MDWGSVLQGIGLWAAYGVIGLLCLAGIALTAVSLSGTWLVVAGTLLAVLVRPGRFPGWWTLAAFVAVSAAVEGVEAVAGAWGVKQRGGSNFAGLAAMLGGFLGLLLGGLIPVPVAGSLLGMLIGSFVLVFAWERRRLKSQDAANIAWGAVTARALVILFKAGAALGMTVVLVWGMLAA